MKRNKPSRHSAAMDSGRTSLFVRGTRDMGLFGLWPDNSVLPIGVDVSLRHIRMLQFRRRGESLELLAAARGPLDEKVSDPAARRAAEAALIQTLRKTNGFVGTRCVSALPMSSVPARSVRLPQMPETEASQAIRWESKDRLGFDAADGQVVYFRSGEVRRGNEAKDEYLMFGATGETLRDHLAMLTTAGMRAAAIDLQPSAILRAVERQMPLQADRPTAVVEIGETGAQFMIVQGERFAFYKHIEVGQRKLNDAVAEKLGVSPEEATHLRSAHLLEEAGTTGADGGHLAQAVLDATRPALEELAKELDMCLRYFAVTFRGNRPDSLLIPGATLLCARSREILANAVSAKIEDVEPLRGVGNLTAETRADRSAPWTVAAGLGLYPLAALTRKGAA